MLLLQVCELLKEFWTIDFDDLNLDVVEKLAELLSHVEQSIIGIHILFDLCLLHIQWQRIKLFKHRLLVRDNDQKFLMLLTKLKTYLVKIGRLNALLVEERQDIELLCRD